MKRILLTISLLTIFSYSFAQPAWVKKATRSVFLLKTFDDGGSLLSSATGFFVGDQGEAVSSFAPFRGASRAVVIDAAGKEMEVVCMLGANDTYDVARFRVDVKKSQPLAVAPAAAGEGSSVWLLPYREAKKVPQGVIAKTETFGGDYAYYSVELAAPEGSIGAPLLNQQGEAIGLMQPSAKAGQLSYAVSARFADSLHVTGLSINDPALRSTAIKKALPAEASQALLTLFVASSTMDRPAYTALVEDFIAQFPAEQDGYVYRAQIAADADDYAAADSYMERALSVAQRPDEVHLSRSRMMYQKLLYRPEPAYEPWTLDRALQEAGEAYRLNAQPGYLQQQAYVLFALGRYAEASSVYDQLSATPLRSAELFYEASRCKQMAGDTLARIALLDSAVAQFSRPYLKEAAVYLLARAQAYMEAEKWRPAVNDLNDYEDLMRVQVNDQFYYMRHQAELGGHLFQQALNDIDRAIEMNPQQDFYYAEKASLQVRVSLYDEAMATARQMTEQWPDNSDGYLFLGLAQCLKGNKTEGVRNLRKAGEMGDPQAETLIEKYSK